VTFVNETRGCARVTAKRVRSESFREYLAARRPLALGTRCKSDPPCAPCTWTKLEFPSVRIRPRSVRETIVEKAASTHLSQLIDLGFPQLWGNLSRVRARSLLSITLSGSGSRRSLITRAKPGLSASGANGAWSIAVDGRREFRSFRAIDDNPGGRCRAVVSVRPSVRLRWRRRGDARRR